MAVYVALLRGINVGKRRIKMDVLRAMFEELNYKSVDTLIASGNIVFQARKQPEAKLEIAIERHLQSQLGYEVDTFVRSSKAVEAISTQQPFAISDTKSKTHTLHVSFFKEPLPVAIKKAVLKCQLPTDQLSCDGSELYWLREGRLSDSTLWTSEAMRAIRLPSSTMRTMDTIRKLHQLAAEKA